MCVDLYLNGILIGSVTRSNGGSAFAYCPAGRAIGQFADIDAAANALARLRERQAEAPAEAA